MLKLSVVIITFNEEKNIGRCLDSLKDLPDELLVVDSFSTDQTKAICESRGATVLCRNFIGYKDQKTYAIKTAKYDYILSLDADEALSAELYETIQSAKDGLTAKAYQFNRLTNYCGVWIRHAGWYPDTKIRLFDRKFYSWSSAGELHEEIIVEDKGKAVFLEGDLLHYSYSSIRQHLQKIESFSEFAAKDAYLKGKKGSLFKIIFNPPFTFIKKYLLQKGFADGYYGYVISIFSAFGKFQKYVKLREMYKNKP